MLDIATEKFRAVKVTAMSSFDSAGHAHFCVGCFIDQISHAYAWES